MRLYEWKKSSIQYRTVARRVKRPRNKQHWRLLYVGKAAPHYRASFPCSRVLNQRLGRLVSLGCPDRPSGPSYVKRDSTLYTTRRRKRPPHTTFSRPHSKRFCLSFGVSLEAACIRSQDKFGWAERICCTRRTHSTSAYLSRNSRAV